MKSQKFWSTKEGKRILFVAFIILIGVLAWLLFFNTKSVPENLDTVASQGGSRDVSIARVFDISADQLPLPLVGQIASKSKATVRTEVSGEVSAAQVDFGDVVNAGDVLAEIKNSSQKAEVLRAEGVLQAAQANLQKVQGGTDDSKLLVKEAVRNAYTIADDAVRNKADQFIEDSESSKPEITTASSDYFVRQRAEQKRRDLTSILTTWFSKVIQIDDIQTNEALVIYVLDAQSNLESVRAFLDDMSIVVSGFEPSAELTQGTIDKYRSDISSARSAVNNALTNVITTYNSLRSSLDATDVVGEDILAAQAQVTQAEAGLLAAQSSLEKTIIRSPIEGQVNEMKVDIGDFVGTFDEIAVIANNNALEVTTYISEQDKNDVSVGSGVVIDGKYKGVVTQIAPALSIENGKIQVVIGVNEIGSFTNGQSVSIEIERSGNRANAGTEDVITVPVSALKITSSGNYVFTVSPAGTLIAHEVTIGSIVGEKIIITNGITPTMEIVLDARGLETGDMVTIR
jgi:RND family efflux transporter MFP subunit